MAAKKILLDTNVLFKEGQLAQLLKLRDLGIVKLHISNITADKEYPNMFKTAWEGKNAQKLKEMRAIGLPKKQEEALMNLDRQKMDKIIMRFDVLDVSKSEEDKFKHLFKDPSDAFLAATAQKHEIVNIVSADTSAVDPEKLKAIKIRWQTPDQYLVRLTEHSPEGMAAAFRKEKSFPDSLSGFQAALEDVREKIKDGQVFVISHPRNGGPVEAHWRAGPQY